MAAKDGDTAAAGPRSSAGFEQLPYPALPQPYTHPASLAALAQLHGLNSPAVETARVLEIGCASGGNIIALACRFANMQFAGFDLSARHIADGQHRINALGLSNIVLREGDVTALPFKGEAFDYVICHGLFSWVPPAAQDAILKLTHACLAPEGVAAISYNVLPGWHLRHVVRDICRYHAGASGTSLERVAKARRALEDIAQSADAKQPYGALLQREASRLARQPSAYILGEFLSDTNAPCTFTEFAGRAAAHDLHFLCEADLNASAMPSPGVERAGNHLMASMLATQGDDVTYAAEQSLDFVSGRPFRRSLLVHAARASSATRVPAMDRISSLHLLGQFSRRALTGGNEVLFSDRLARPVSVPDGTVSAALERIAAAFPSSIAMARLIENLPAAEAKELPAALFRMVEAGHVRILALPISAGRANVERPRVCDLNRIEAAAGQPWISSLHHDAVAVTRLQAIVVKNLDGDHDRRMLVQEVAAALPYLGELSQGLTPAQIVAATLAQLETGGVLEPADRGS